MIKHLICMFFTMFSINNCSFYNHLENNLNFFKKQKNNNFFYFNTAVENIITELIKSDDIFISHNTSFFVNLLKNKSNIIIDKKKLTDYIKNTISKHAPHIYFFEKTVIDQNKKKLGLLQSKDTIDTSTAILLSRNNNIKYYLNSCLLGEKNPFFLKIELILVKTGEIVFEKKEKFYW